MEEKKSNNEVELNTLNLYSDDVLDVNGNSPVDKKITGSSSPDCSSSDEIPNEENEEEASQNFLAAFLETHNKKIMTGFKILCLVGWFIYLGFAFAYEANNTVWGMFGFTLCVIALKLFTKFAWPKCQPFCKKTVQNIKGKCTDHKKLTIGAVVSVYGIIFFVFLFFVMDVTKNPYNLVPLGGYILFFFIELGFSKYPTQVNWRPVIGGFTIQFILGILIIGTSVGNTVFTWLGDVASWFLNFSKDEGSKFVYGGANLESDPTQPPIYGYIRDHYFFMVVLPTIAYCAAFIGILYYFGVIQWLCRTFTVAMQVALGTSGAESLNAVGNIFLSMTEAPLLIKPFLNDMTRSELHAVMTGGFATVAGSVLAAYIGFGVSAKHLIASCFMSAPGALAISKLMYPETKKSKTKKMEEYEIKVDKSVNFVEAAAKGAIGAIPIMLNIGAIMVAFVGLLYCFNAFLTILGNQVGIEELTFQMICGYLFYPICVVIGVPIEDCLKVAEMLGEKFFLNEFIAFAHLQQYIKNDGVDPDLILSERAVTITTYCLCSFANISSIGIQLGGLSAIAPKRSVDFAKVVTRALFAGSMVGLTNAAIVSMMYHEGI